MQLQFRSSTARRHQQRAAGQQLPSCRPVLPAFTSSPQVTKPCISSWAPAQPRNSHQRLCSVIAAAASPIELQVVKEELGPCKRKLKITVPASGVKECFHKAVEKGREVTGNLPGFRPDKIPLSLIITNLGGQRNFKMLCIEEVLLTALPLAMNQTIKQEGVVPDTEKVVSNINDLEAVFDPAKPLTFEVEYDTVPPLKWNKSWKELEVTIRDTGDFSTDAAAAEQLVREVLKEHGHQRVVVDRGMQQGDTAIVELKFMAKGSKVPMPGLSSDKTRFDSDVDPLSLMPHLLGIRVGETRKFNIQLPEDYRIELWQGMECDVEVTVKELFAWTLPQFDDEFVKTFYGDRFETAEDLRKSFLATTAMQRVQALDDALGEAVKKAVVESVEWHDLPESLVEDMAATQFRAALLEMIEKKMATPTEAEALATEDMLKEYLTKQRGDLEAMCVFNIAADEIYAAEGLTLDEAMVKQEVEARKKDYQAQQLEYDEEQLHSSVVDTFKHLRVVEWLKDNVKRNVLPWQDTATPAQPAAQ